MLTLFLRFNKDLANEKGAQVMRPFWIDAVSLAGS
jgi:hypothetical protein